VLLRLVGRVRPRGMGLAPRGVPLVSQGVLNTKVSMAAMPSACMV
jgi:hypothetical protein